MKFGKLLKETTEGMGPEMTDLFVRYKELKKYLKAMKKQKQPGAGAQQAAAMEDEHQEASTSGNQEQLPENALSAEEKAFIDMLNEDLLRFNRFFIDKEEDSVIKLQALSDRIKAASSNEDLQALKAELVDFHGEMVLLLHWSLLNYAAVVKILKKHDKRTGLLLRAPYLANVLQQPFYSTSVMSRLVKMAEQHINTLVVKQEETQGSGNGDDDAAPDTAAASAAVAAVPAGQASAGPVAAAAPGVDVGTATPSKASGAAAASLSSIDTAAAAAVADAPGPSSEDLSSPDSSLPVDTAVYARTRMALQTWDQLCSNASTPSTVLPAGSTELVRQLRVRERWARLVGVPPPGAEQPEQPQQHQGESEGPGQQGQKQQQQQQQGAAAGEAAAEDAAGAASAGQGKQGEQHEAPQAEDEAAAKRQRC